MLNNPANQADVVQYAVPTAGQTVAVNPQTTMLVLEPAGLLATLTINMPDGIPARGDGHRVNVMSTQVVTAVTHGAGAGNTMLGGLTTVAAVGFATYCYRASKWYRSA